MYVSGSWTYSVITWCTQVPRGEVCCMRLRSLLSRLNKGQKNVFVNYAAIHLGKETIGSKRNSPISSLQLGNEHYEGAAIDCHVSWSLESSSCSRPMGRKFCRPYCASLLGVGGGPLDRQMLRRSRQRSIYVADNGALNGVWSCALVKVFHLKGEWFVL